LLQEDHASEIIDEWGDMMKIIILTSPFDSRNRDQDQTLAGEKIDLHEQEG
jgi:hypothetical protein